MKAGSRLLITPIKLILSLAVLASAQQHDSAHWGMTGKRTPATGAT